MNKRWGANTAAQKTGSLASGVSENSFPETPANGVGKVIALLNQKGGAGKTTALMNIAGEYALRGRTVAMIDMDARSNLTKWWSDCRQKQAQAEGIDVVGHKTAKAVGAFLDRAAEIQDKSWGVPDDWSG